MLSELDFKGISKRISNANAAFFIVRFFKHNALLKELNTVKKPGGEKLTVKELASILPDAEKYAAISKEVEANTQKAEALLGNQWLAINSDWSKTAPLLEQTESILELISAIADGKNETRLNITQKLEKLLPDAKNIFAENSEGFEKINLLLLAWNDFQEKSDRFSAFADTLKTPDDLETLTAQLQNIAAASDGLRGAMRYKKLRDNADSYGLGNFCAALENHTFAALRETPEEIFDYAYKKDMLDRILSNSPVLCNFTGTDQDTRIQHFCELDGKYTRLAKQAVFAKLAAALPRRRSGPCPEGTELGILKRECEKKTRQKPVRQLLEQIPSLAQVLKPCFLMSPLSVAQYLPPDTAPFDLIVFDEASQIPVWDAIGVIARGKQLIVVGDPKQMPPTNFFQKNESDEEKSPDETEDMESILDECIAAGVHPTYLNWHYRSRHESLIAFSNHYYYEDRLFTFPAARSTERLGVRFEFVPDAIYDRKATRTNLKEAEALVKYVFARLENPSLKQRSIGIVTFSQAQKDLIEDLFERERSKHPSLEEYFSDQNEEPLFVKNLENVQGDERDVILFSVCYAPDADGKFSMNFGPLNRQGGERRLNVAITRAKEQVVVFAGIHASQIELSRTNAVGAAHLKYFLDYAEKNFAIRSSNMTSDALAGETHR